MDEQYSFAADVAKWVEETKGTQDERVRKVGMTILGLLIQRSPVGDPKRWKINRAYALSSAHASAVNAAQRKANGGRLKRGQKKKASALVKFSTKDGKRVSFRQRGWAAKNYTGGRFRGNWQVTFGRPADGAIDRIDKTGTATLEAGNAILATFDGTKEVSIWFTNNVPYARRLEYGWSQQAPIGIIRPTVAEINAKGAT